jgi:hypothetical protein
MKKRASTRTHFVPKVVYRTAFAGVIPICVAGAACGGSTTSGGDAGMQNLAVACTGFCGVAAVGFTDAGDATADGPQDAATPDADDASSCYCCTNFCGVGVAAFADVSTDQGTGE